MNKRQAALELRRAVQFILTTLADEAQMMSVATVYPAYKTDRLYRAGEVFSYGTNDVGDPQLYRVLTEHRSAVEWTPDLTPGLYKAIGVTAEGVAIWVQPLGASDAYNRGDVVSHEGRLWRSDLDANSWEPGVHGWSEVET